MLQVKIDKPILRIPMLAIHLNRTIHTDGFKPNPQTELVPLLATAVKAQLTGSTDSPTPPPSAPDSAAPADSSAPSPPAAAHHSLLLQLLADQLGSTPEAIVDIELSVCDTQPGVIGGAQDEFVFCGRLDNLAMSWCCMQVRFPPPPSPPFAVRQPFSVRQVSKEK